MVDLGAVTGQRVLQGPDGVDCREVADGCLAYVQGTGGWGWSNAGLIRGEHESLLVDTLFDLRLTRAMLDTFAPVTATAPIATVVNTHANGDHCYGNQLVDEAQIVASRAAAEEMAEVPASVLAGLTAAPGEVGDLFRSFFGEFQFDGIESRLPDTVFDGRLELDIGGRNVVLIEVGPAHTRGDVIVAVPDASVVYTGDILFIGGAPIVWAGPLSNWIAACESIIAMAPETVVPGHGPVTDVTGVVEVAEYLRYVETGAAQCHAAGLDAFDAARELALGMSSRFGGLAEFGRIAVNVDTAYRALDPEHRSADIVELFRRMAALERS